MSRHEELLSGTGRSWRTLRRILDGIDGNCIRHRTKVVDLAYVAHSDALCRLHIERLAKLAECLGAEVCFKPSRRELHVTWSCGRGARVHYRSQRQAQSLDVFNLAGTYFDHYRGT